MLTRRAALAAAITVLAISGFLTSCSTGDGSSDSSTRRSSSTSTTVAKAGSTTSTTAPKALQPVIADAGWQLPSARDREVALTDGTTIWLLGGRDAAKTSRTSVAQIDPTSGASSQAGDLAVGVHDAAGARLAGKLFVFGGGNSSTVATVQTFTPGSGGQVVGALPQARSDLAATTVADHAYVLGGFDGGAFTPDVLDTTDGSTFATVTALPVPVRYAAMTALGDKLYVFGGSLGGSENATNATNVIQEVDLQARTARVLVSMPHTLSDATAVTVQGKVFVLGGRVDGAVSPQVWQFDPNAPGLTPVGNLPVALSDSAAVVVHDVAYLLGGESSTNEPVASVATLRLG